MCCPSKDTPGTGHWLQREHKIISQHRAHIFKVLTVKNKVFSQLSTRMGRGQDEHGAHHPAPAEGAQDLQRDGSLDVDI